MSTSTVQTIYTGILHVCGIVGIIVLLALNKLPVDVGVPLLTGLLGLGIGVGVTTGSAAAAPAAPVAVPVVDVTSAVLPAMAQKS